MRISDWGSDVCSSDLQNAIFDEYLGLIEARVEKAREAGTLDLGVETIAADRISILDRTVIRRDPVSGAETEILRIETEDRKSVVQGKSVSERVDLGGRRIIKKKT